METKTIMVKDIKTKEGYTKANKPWTRTTLVSTDGSYYSTFRAFPQPIKPGFSVTLNAEQAEGQKAGSFDIVSIISVDANPQASGPAPLVAKTSAKVGAGTPDSKAGKAPVSSPDAGPSLPDDQIRMARVVDLRLRKAQEMVKAANKGIEDYPEAYYSLVAETFKQLYGSVWLATEMR